MAIDARLDDGLIDKRLYIDKRLKDLAKLKGAPSPVLSPGTVARFDKFMRVGPIRSVSTAVARNK